MGAVIGPFGTAPVSNAAHQTGHAGSCIPLAGWFHGKATAATTRALGEALVRTIKRNYVCVSVRLRGVNSAATIDAMLQ